MVSESMLVWSAASALAFAVVAPYLVYFNRRLRLDEQRKAEAVRLGIDRPVAQYPFIDRSRCIGCAACVAACPEGDVLGVVGGTAVVINGLRCIGLSHCEIACPVGAIEVGLGDLRSRLDIPTLDDDLESNIPGLFIVGELGGLSLVRNAVDQGRRVIEHIAERAAAHAPALDGLLDVVIVGAGPSGLSAALAATTRGLTHQVLEREADLGGSLLHYPRRKMVLTRPLDLSPWGTLKAEEIQKERLLEVFQGLMESASLRIAFGHNVTGVEREGGIFTTRAGGAAYRSRYLVLALGRRGEPRKLGVPGEELPKVMYRLMDAESYRDQRILIVGGGDSAAEAAIGLARDGRNAVTLSYRRERLVRIKRKNQEAMDGLIRGRRIHPLFTSEVTEIRPESVQLRQGEEAVEIPNDFVFVFAGGVPPFPLLKRIGVGFGGPAELA